MHLKHLKKKTLALSETTPSHTAADVWNKEAISLGHFRERGVAEQDAKQIGIGKNENGKGLIKCVGTGRAFDAHSYPPLQPECLCERGERQTVMENNVITVAAVQVVSQPPELHRQVCPMNTVCIDPRVSSCKHYPCINK